MAALEEEVDACLEYPEGEEEAFAAKAFLWGKDSAVSALSKLAPLLMKLVITEADLANGKSDGGEYDREAGDLEEEIDWGIIERYRARQQANDE